jgi:hypothetical protein
MKEITDRMAVLFGGLEKVIDICASKLILYTRILGWIIISFF